MEDVRSRGADGTIATVSEWVGGRTNKNGARGESVNIPCGSSHRIENTGTVDLSLIEVQTGEYFGEDDIERLEDDYGRS